MHFLTLSRPAVRRPPAGRAAPQAAFGPHMPFELAVDSSLRGTGLRRPAQPAAVRLFAVDTSSRAVRELQRGMTRDLWAYVRRLAREGFMERDRGCVDFAALIDGRAPHERLVLHFVPTVDAVAAAAAIADWPQEFRVGFPRRPGSGRGGVGTRAGETLELFPV